MITCIKCEEEKSGDEFYKSTILSQGDKGTCKSCIKKEKNKRKKEKLKKIKSKVKCVLCNTKKDKDEFYFSRIHKNGETGSCKSCLSSNFTKRVLTETHKTCFSCRELKLHSDFYKDKRYSGGLAASCKECGKNKNRRIENDTHKTCSSCREVKLHEEFYTLKSGKLSSRCRDCKGIKDKMKGFYNDTHKICSSCKEIKKFEEFIKSKTSKSGYNNSCRSCNTKSHRQYRKKFSEHNKKYQRDYQRNRRKNDPSFKLAHNIRSSMSFYLKSGDCKKTVRTERLIGCKFKFLREYLERQFEPWMNWENYGKYDGEFQTGWDVDHFIPISSIDFNKKEDRDRVIHYTNLIPLCSKINRDIKRHEVLTKEELDQIIKISYETNNRTSSKNIVVQQRKK